MDLDRQAKIAKAYETHERRIDAAWTEYMEYFRRTRAVSDFEKSEEVARKWKLARETSNAKLARQLVKLGCLLPGERP
jgi:hypothetical protein